MSSSLTDRFQARLDRWIKPIWRRLEGEHDLVPLIEQQEHIGFPEPQTVEQLQEFVEAGGNKLVEALASEVKTCTELLVEPKLQKAVLARKRLIDDWPWPRHLTAGRALYILMWTAGKDRGSQVTPINSMALSFEMNKFNFQGLDLLSETQKFAAFGFYWPGDAAPLEVARWAQTAMDKISPPGELWGEAWVKSAEKGRAVWDQYYSADGKRYPFAGIALLYLIEREVEESAQIPSVKVDAGIVHHQMLEGMRNLPKHPKQKMKVTKLNDYRIELLAKGKGKAVQLYFPFAQGSLHEEIAKTLREISGWEGLRNWAVWQRLLSVEGRREGWVRWTMEAHFAAMGYRSHKPQMRDKVAKIIKSFTELELQVTDPDGKIRERRPLILVGSRMEKLEDSQYKLDGMQLQINPLLYEGVRSSKTKKLGSNWWPQSLKLPMVDHVRHPYALALGLILPIRWNLAFKEDGRDHIVIKGKRLLELAGIRFKKYRSTRAWGALERDLKELQRIDGLGRIEIEGTPRTMDALYKLYPPDWQLDRRLRGVTEEEPWTQELPATGKELREWRKGRGLSQTAIAALLKVTRQTIVNAEGRPEKQLTSKIRAGLNALPSDEK